MMSAFGCSSFISGILGKGNTPIARVTPFAARDQITSTANNVNIATIKMQQ